jgi:hypothetical protein
VEANEVKGGQVELNNDLAEVVTDDVDGRSRKRAGLAKLKAKAGRQG